jgi:POT family proton-dependent oligopeptide transporter
MASGATIVAASYLMLAAAALISDRSSALVLAVFMVTMTVGELHILPVGLGMFGKLAPKGFEASAIALWFSAGVFGNLLAGALGTQWSALSHPQFFTLVAAIAFASAAALFIVDRRSPS